MMRRILCLLLAMSTLASQSLCWAHTHHGTESAEHGQHAAQPHLHIGDHNHDHDDHEHHSHTDRLIQTPRADSEQDLTDVVSSYGDHDADAVYFDQSVIGFRDSDSVNVLVPSHMHGAGLHLVIQDHRPPHAGTARGRPFSIAGIACPVFLRILTLRL